MKFIISAFLTLSSLLGISQSHEWQPDSIYANRNVKKIIVFQNSPIDLSEVIYLNSIGKRVKVEKYNASYDERTRKTQRLHSVMFYRYNNQNKLTTIIDSLVFGNTYQIDKTVFEYNMNGQLESQKYFGPNDTESYREIKYLYSPYRTNLITRNDSIVTLNEMMEYDKDFYKSRQSGFYYQPKVEYKTRVENGQEHTFQHNFLERRVTDLHYNNKFDEKGRLINSDLINQGHKVHKLHYEYYPNDLLKSILGYVPIYFQYEY